MTSAELKLAAKVLRYAADQSESGFNLILDGKLTKREMKEIKESFGRGLAKKKAKAMQGSYPMVWDSDLMIWLSKILLKEAESAGKTGHE